MDIRVFTDLHYCSMNVALQVYFTNICQSLQRGKVDALICMGDINTEGNVKDLRWLKETFSHKQNFYYVLGNHDTMHLSKKQIERVMETPRYYKVIQDKVTMLFLDSVVDENHGDWSGHMDDEQLKWLADNVAQVPQDHVLLVYSHHPLQDSVARSTLENLYIKESDEIKDILKQHTGLGIFLNGHNHMNDWQHIDNWYYLGLGDIPDIMACIDIHIDEALLTIQYHPLPMERLCDVGEQIPHYQHLANAENNCRFENIEIEVQR